MKMYHGSRNPNLVLTNDQILFVTTFFKVAVAYAEGKIAFASRYKGPDAISTVYILDVHARAMLDLRKSEHRTLWDSRVKSYNKKQSDQDELLPLTTAIGFRNTVTGLPGYGRQQPAKLLFPEFDSMWIDEGTQRMSLALFVPKTIASLAGTALGVTDT